MGRPQRQSASDLCFVAAQAGVAGENGTETSGRTAAEVVWEIDPDEWRNTAFQQPVGGEEIPEDLAQTSKSCEVFTPDITLIIAEMLERNPSMTSFSVVFQDSGERSSGGKSNTTCVTHAFFNGGK